MQNELKLDEVQTCTAATDYLPLNHGHALLIVLTSGIHDYVVSQQNNHTVTDKDVGSSLCT